MTTSFQKLNIQSPDVSVIIPTHNRISMLEEALASVYSQDFEGIVEIIVVDDNSQDKTSEVISHKYPDVHLISLSQNIGAYGARNRALQEAKGKYIAFLDSDDLWEKKYLKTQLAALEGKERCLCISDLVIWYTAKNSKQILVQKPNLEKYTSLIHHLFVGSFINTPSSVVIPRKVFDEVGLFDETIRVGEDAALYERCIVAGYELIYTDLPLAIKREHSSEQLTSASNLEIRRRNRIIRINKLYPLIEKQCNIVPLQHIYAEIYAHSASQYLNQKYFFRWLGSSLSSARNSSLEYALSNMRNDIQALLHRKIVEKLNEVRSRMNRQLVKKLD